MPILQCGSKIDIDCCKNKYFLAETVDQRRMCLIAPAYTIVMQDSLYLSTTCYLILRSVNPLSSLIAEFLHLGSTYAYVTGRDSPRIHDIVTT
jgi:hypothetical protein